MNTAKFDTMTADEAIAMVQERIGKIRFNNLTLSIDRLRVRRSDQAWHIPLIPSRMPRRFGAIYDELAVASVDIAEAEGVTFFFRVEDPVGEGAELPPVEISNAALV